MIYLDTHVVVWLAAGEIDRFTTRAQTQLEENELVLSPMVLLEMQFLKEIGRLSIGALQLFDTVSEALHLKVCEKPFDKVITLAIQQHWTGDPFDRLIVAQAAASEAPLLTKDASILRHYRRAFWE